MWFSMNVVVPKPPIVWGKAHPGSPPAPSRSLELLAPGTGPGSSHVEAVEDGVSSLIMSEIWEGVDWIGSGAGKGMAYAKE
jgi:hypothetical protein